MFWDAVFGLNVAHWDERRLTREEWTEFFKQVAVINTATNFAAAFYCYYVQLGELREVMEEAGYSGFELIHVIKPMQNYQGTNQFINNAELILIGYKNVRTNFQLNFADPNPMRRHSAIFSPNVGPKLTYDSKEVNTTEKHPLVSMRLGQIFCPPGSNVLLIGAGSGAEMVGFNRAQLSVVALEADPLPIPGAASRMVKECAKEKEFDVIAKEEMTNLLAFEKMLDWMPQLTTENVKVIIEEFENVADTGGEIEVTPVEHPKAEKSPRKMSHSATLE